jgi:hypothetical protein
LEDIYPVGVYGITQKKEGPKLKPF